MNIEFLKFRETGELLIFTSMGGKGLQNTVDQEIEVKNETEL